MKQAIQRSSIADKDSAYDHYLKAVEGKSNSDARDIAADILSERIFWDWDREFRYILLTPNFVVDDPFFVRQFPRLAKVTTTTLAV